MRCGTASALWVEVHAPFSGPPAETCDCRLTEACDPRVASPPLDRREGHPETHVQPPNSGLAGPQTAGRVTAHCGRCQSVGTRWTFLASSKTEIRIVLHAKAWRRHVNDDLRIWLLARAGLIGNISAFNALAARFSQSEVIGPSWKRWQSTGADGRV